ncbi:DUF3716 domain-containing protein [Aspergillus melleus]|uniref:DUF3716 domain-containing protein n=1 Tax=Aspergillus melleus TaxID=138277 RepID=UPI001E8E5B94|nr:uncharacterized protein LDX57_012903 [Aspergillus melleus]KAH8435272.1 hypothetical protein LDX57_012903 [Aspergillus melleus]
MSPPFNKDRSNELLMAAKRACKSHLSASDRHVVELLDPNGSMHWALGHDGKPNVRVYNHSRQHTTAYLVQERGVKMAVPCESCASSDSRSPWVDCVAVPAFGKHSVHNHACGGCLWKSSGKACSLRREFEQQGGARWDESVHISVMKAGGLLAALEAYPDRRSTIGQAAMAGAIRNEGSFPRVKSEPRESVVFEAASENESVSAMRSRSPKGKAPAQGVKTKTEQVDRRGSVGNRNASIGGSAKKTPVKQAPAKASGSLVGPSCGFLKQGVNKRNASGEASGEPPKRLKVAVRPVKKENVTITLDEYNWLKEQAKDLGRMVDGASKYSSKTMDDLVRLATGVKELKALMKTTGR